MVFYDGEKLCVQLARGKNYKKILELASIYGGEYLADVAIYVFPPIKKIAWALQEAGYSFDGSAEMFLQRRKEYKIPETLYPFQKEGVEKMLSMNHPCRIPFGHPCGFRQSTHGEPSRSPREYAASSALSARRHRSSRG